MTAAEIVALIYHERGEQGDGTWIERAAQKLTDRLASTTPDEVERVARAIHDTDEPVGHPRSIAWGDQPDFVLDQYRQMARAAIQALSSISGRDTFQAGALAMREAAANLIAGDRTRNSMDAHYTSEAICAIDPASLVLSPHPET